MSGDRVAGIAMPASVGRIHAATLLLIVFCVAWCAIVIPRVTGERGYWASVQLPLIADTQPASVLSFTEIVGGYAIHRENLPTMRGVAMLEGAAVPADFYHVRVLYNYLASLIAPFLGVISALVLLNIACWAALSYLSWRFARALSGDDRVGALAGTLTAASFPAVAHMSDLAAHLMSQAAYFGGIVAIFESEVWVRRRRLSVHLLFGAYFALVELTYNSGIMLMAVYAVLALRHNRWWHIAMAGLIGVTSVVMWAHVLDLLATRPAPTIESGYFVRSLRIWIDAFGQSPPGALLQIARETAEFVTIDSPPVVLVGLAGILFAPVLAGRRPAVLAAVLIPAASILPWRQVAEGDLAYTVAGIVPILHAGAAALVFPWRWRGRTFPALAAAAALIAVQVVWSSGPLHGWMLPLFAYYYGPFDVAGLWTTIPHIASLTGAEPTPHLFGGDATLLQAGLASAPQDLLAVAYDPFAGIVAKLFPTAYVLALPFLMLRPGALRRRVVGGIVTLVILASLVAPVTRPIPPPLTIAQRSAIDVPAGTSLAYDVRLSPDFVSALARLPSDAAISVFVGVGSGTFSTEITANGQPVPIIGEDAADQHGHWMRLDRNSLLAGLARGSHIGISLHAGSTLTIAGWQHSGLPGRTVTPPGDILPSVELRGRAADGTLLLDGF